MKFKVDHVIKDQPFPRRIDFIKAIRGFGGHGLREAKLLCDAVTQEDAQEVVIDRVDPDGHGNINTLIVEARCAGITLICAQDNLTIALHSALELAVKDRDYNTSQRILDILIDLSNN